MPMPTPSLAKLRKLQQEAQSLLDERQVLQQEKELSPGRKLAHFGIRVYRSFVRNRCLVRAAALAYTTVLGLVPLLAIVVAVSTGLLKQEGQQPIRQLVDHFINIATPMLQLKPTADVESSAIAKEQLVLEIFRYIENVNTGTLTGTAVLALVFVAISMLSTIEMTFNDMWGISRGRTWMTRIVGYWAILTLGPILLFTALGLTSASQFALVKGWIGKVPFIGSLIFYLLPYITLSLALSLVYLLIPNTKVDWRAALIGGVVAGGLIHLNNYSSTIYFSRVASYNKIYGSLSAVPLFLAGLYIAWIIVLLGAQVAYAFQNRKVYVQEKQAEAVNQRGREFVALRLMTAIAQKFHFGDRAPTSSQLAEDFGVPLRLIAQILGILIESKLIVEVAGKETAYHPARPLETITLYDILTAMRAGQGTELETCPDPARPVVRQEFEAVYEAEKKTATSLTLRELVSRVSPPELIQMTESPLLAQKS